MDGYLKKGKKVFGMGNSDAHLASQMGCAYTYVHTGGDLSEKAILTALRKGRAVASNGPFVTFSVTAINGQSLVTPKTLGKCSTNYFDVYDIITPEYPIRTR